MKIGNYIIKIFLLIAILVIVSSCDKGKCIDADDFGEYMRELLQVISKVDTSACKWYKNLPIDNATQSSAVRNCVASNTDSSGKAKVFGTSKTPIPSDRKDSDGNIIVGCYAFNKSEEESLKNTCIDVCVSECNASNQNQSSATMEPQWIFTTLYTDKKDYNKDVEGASPNGVLISPGTQIEIMASGVMTLTEQTQADEVYISPKNSFLHSINNVSSSVSSEISTQSVILDVSNGDTKTLDIKGGWCNGGDCSTAPKIGGTTKIDSQKDIEFTRRLYAYIIQEPTGYAMNKNFETTGTPMIPDFDVWECLYPNDNDPKNAVCKTNYGDSGATIPISKSKVYKNLSIDGIKNANELYKINSSTRSSGLGNFGGVIYWNDVDNAIKGSLNPNDSYVHYINIVRSGLVSFRIAGQIDGQKITSSSCPLKFKIINQDNSEEYTDAITLNVGADWSSRVFVRYGQKIQFADASWYDLVAQKPRTWIDNKGITRNCGFGMVMKIEWRPAVACFSSKKESIQNPDCKMDSSGECDKYYKCRDEVKYPSYYCPQIGIPGVSVDISSSKCSACSSMVASQAAIPKQIELDLPQCYNFEKYTGSIAAFKTKYSDSPSILTSLSGAERINRFNGIEGNFEDYTRNGSVFNGQSPMVMGRDGRLLFVALSNDGLFSSMDVNYQKNSGGSSYQNDASGYSIKSSGTKTYRNGEMMEVFLCGSDSSGNQADCLTTNISQVANDKLIIKYDEASSGAYTIVPGKYKFNEYGLLANNIDGVNYYSHAFGDDVAKSYQKYKLGFKIKDPDKNYANNQGQYDVIVTVKKKVNRNSIVKMVIDPVMSKIRGSGCQECKNCVLTSYDAQNCPKGGQKYYPGLVENMYVSVITNSDYKMILRLCMVLFIAFYGVGYMIGVSGMTQNDLVSRGAKIAFIYFIVGENGWNAVNQYIVAFFYDGIDYITFTMASAFSNNPIEIENLLAKKNPDFMANKSLLFTGIDEVIAIMTSSATINKIFGLLFSSIFGFIYVYIVFLGFIAYIWGAFSAILFYLSAQLFTSILIILLPLFMIFLLFPQTKEMFDKWLSNMIGFAMQQFLLITTLGFFSMLTYETVKYALGYRVCIMPVWVLNLPPIPKITILEWWMVGGTAPVSETRGGLGSDPYTDAAAFPTFFTALFIYAVTSTAKEMIKFMTDLAASLSDSIKVSDLGGDLMKTVQTAVDKGLESGNKWAGKMVFGQDGKLTDLVEKKIDKALFNTMTDDEKKKMKLADSDRRNKRSDMASVGDKAVKDYKKKNALGLSKMSDDERKKVLNDVKNKAMIDHGKKKYGLSEDDAKKIMNSTEDEWSEANSIGENLAGMLWAQRKSESRNKLTDSVDGKSLKVGTKDKIASLKNNTELSKEQQDEVISGITEGKDGKTDDASIAEAKDSAQKEAIKTNIEKGLTKAQKTYKTKTKRASDKKSRAIEALDKQKKDGDITDQEYNWMKSEANDKYDEEKEAALNEAVDAADAVYTDEVGHGLGSKEKDEMKSAMKKGEAASLPRSENSKIAEGINKSAKGNKHSIEQKETVKNIDSAEKNIGQEFEKIQNEYNNDKKEIEDSRNERINDNESDRQDELQSSAESRRDELGDNEKSRQEELSGNNKSRQEELKDNEKSRNDELKKTQEKYNDSKKSKGDSPAMKEHYDKKFQEINDKYNKSGSEVNAKYDQIDSETNEKYNKSGEEINAKYDQIDSETNEKYDQTRDEINQHHDKESEDLVESAAKSASDEYKNNTGSELADEKKDALKDELKKGSDGELGSVVDRDMIEKDVKKMRAKNFGAV